MSVIHLIFISFSYFFFFILQRTPTLEDCSYISAKQCNRLRYIPKNIQVILVRRKKRPFAKTFCLNFCEYKTHCLYPNIASYFINILAFHQMYWYGFHLRVYRNIANIDPLNNVPDSNISPKIPKLHCQKKKRPFAKCFCLNVCEYKTNCLYLNIESYFINILASTRCIDMVFTAWWTYEKNNKTSRPN